MTLQAKKRIVIALLLVLAIWPLVHRLLVQTSGLSPWKGAGWAMYCVPGRSIIVALITFLIKFITAVTIVSLITDLL